MTTPSGHIQPWQCLLGMPHESILWTAAADSELWTQVVEVNIDASDVPSEYALTILSECAAFPRRLVFFLKGTLSVRCVRPAFWSSALRHKRRREIHDSPLVSRACMSVCVF